MDNKTIIIIALIVIILQFAYFYFNNNNKTIIIENNNIPCTDITSKTSGNTGSNYNTKPTGASTKIPSAPENFSVVYEIINLG